MKHPSPVSKRKEKEMAEKELEQKVDKLEKRVKELERQLHSHQHLPHLPLRIIGQPFPQEGSPIIPMVEG